MDDHTYGMSIRTDLGVAEAEARVREALAAEGFGILTEIDVAATFEAKLGLEHAPYKILGACNPHLASRALAADSELGLLLPCNVTVYEGDGGTVVSALEPGLMAQITGNETVTEVAREARERLRRALATLEA